MVGGGQASEIGHVPEYRAGSVFLVSILQKAEGNIEEKPTLATQVTRASLNSRPSRASTAFFRSAAVSNSTKLKDRH